MFRPDVGGRRPGGGPTVDEDDRLALALVVVALLMPLTSTNLDVDRRLNPAAQLVRRPPPGVGRSREQHYAKPGQHQPEHRGEDQ